MSRYISDAFIPFLETGTRRMTTDRTTPKSPWYEPTPFLPTREYEMYFNAEFYDDDRQAAGEQIAEWEVE